MNVNKSLASDAFIFSNTDYGQCIWVPKQGNNIAVL